VARGYGSDKMVRRFGFSALLSRRHSTPVSIYPHYGGNL